MILWYKTSKKFGHLVLILCNTLYAISNYWCVCLKEHLYSQTTTHSLKSLFCPVGEWRTVCTGVNSYLMRKSALVVEACPKWASAWAGVNESIKSFNEGEAKMKEGKEKLGSGILWKGRWEWICIPKWRQDSDLRRLSCGSNLCQALALSSLSSCLSARASFCLVRLWSPYYNRVGWRCCGELDWARKFPVLFLLF